MYYRHIDHSSFHLNIHLFLNKMTVIGFPESSWLTRYYRLNHEAFLLYPSKKLYVAKFSETFVDFDANKQRTRNLSWKEFIKPDKGPALTFLRKPNSDDSLCLFTANMLKMNFYDKSEYHQTVFIRDISPTEKKMIRNIVTMQQACFKFNKFTEFHYFIISFYFL